MTSRLRKLMSIVAAGACVLIALPAGAGAQWGPWGPYPYGRYQAESSLRIDVKPKDAEVFVDGYYAGIVDDFDGTFQRLHVLAGQHRITIYLAGYRTIERNLYLEPNETTKIDEQMERLRPGDPNEPRPTPSVPPAGAAQQPPARPRMPGRRMPPPPQPAPPLQQPPQQPPAPPDLRGPAESTYGTLVIRVQPPGADLLIDGQRWNGPEGDEQLLLQLTEGAHRIEVTKDGYAPYAAQIEIRRGATTPLNVDLARK